MIIFTVILVPDSILFSDPVSLKQIVLDLGGSGSTTLVHRYFPLEGVQIGYH
jgi:hypothetical protein